MSESNYIPKKGAKENTLKNIDVTIPRNKLVVITGLSVSGKSSLAFDTLYAEGQRRWRCRNSEPDAGKVLNTRLASDGLLRQ